MHTIRYVLPIRLICAISLLAACPTHADIIELKSGGTVNGQIVEVNDKGYRVRTKIGVIFVASENVKSVKEAATPFEEYDQRLEQTQSTNTATAWMTLAAWCGEHDLQRERRNHLRRVIELDPDHAEARAALGFVKVGDVWVDGKRTTSRPSKSAPDPEATAEEATLRSLRGEWNRRIRAIKANMLSANNRRIRDRGAERILAITDPLAILPLTQTLSSGKTHVRLLLVQALGQFAEDEALLNLTAIALVDASQDVRRRALGVLAQAGDPRVPQQIREALKSDNDVLIKNAAQALQVLRDPGAVTDLIEVLTVQRNKRIEIPVRRYFGRYPNAFNSSTQIAVGGQNVQVQPALGVDRAKWAVGLVESSRFADRNVTVFRTDVLEALKAITGQNFGFDAAAWRRWYQEQAP